MDGDAVEVVHPEGADEAGRVRCPGRMGPRGGGVEHRVIDDQLAASLKEVAECLRPVLALEGVWLFDEVPGQVAPLPAQLVAHPGELLFLRQVLFPCREPLVVLHHLVGCHVIPPSHALYVGPQESKPRQEMTRQGLTSIEADVTATSQTTNVGETLGRPITCQPSGSRRVS